MIYSKVVIISTAILLILSGTNAQKSNGINKKFHTSKTVQTSSGGSLVSSTLENLTHGSPLKSNIGGLKKIKKRAGLPIGNNNGDILGVVKTVLGDSSSKNGKSSTSSMTRGGPKEEEKLRGDRGADRGGDKGSEGTGEGSASDRNDGKNEESSGDRGEGRNNDRSGGNNEEGGSDSPESAGTGEAKRKRKRHFNNEPYSKSWRRDKLQGSIFGVETSLNRMTSEGESTGNKQLSNTENLANNLLSQATKGGVAGVLGGKKTPGSSSGSDTTPNMSVGTEPSTTTTTAATAATPTSTTNSTSNDTSVPPSTSDTTTDTSSSSNGATNSGNDGTNPVNGGSTGGSTGCSGCGGSTTLTPNNNGPNGYYQPYDPNSQYYQPYGNPSDYYYEPDSSYFYGHPDFIHPDTLMDGPGSGYFYSGEGNNDEA